MFKFLKDKIKNVISTIAKKEEEESKEELTKKENNLETKEEEQKYEIKEELTKEENNLETKEEEENIEQTVKKEETPEEEATKEEEIEKEDITKPKEEKKSFFKKIKDKITKTRITEEKFEKIFWELEMALLESNVAIEVIEKIKEDLKEKLLGKEVSNLGKEIENSLLESVDNILTFETFDIIDEIKKSEKPYIILFLGINGTGKTTTIAKFINLFKKNDISSVVAASDTFRAAAIDQLKEHTDKLGVRLIKHDYGSDPAAVAYDAIEYAKSKGIDVVLIDTAGRMHSNKNLMDELAKIIRVSKPNMKFFIGDALTGNDCIEQAKLFNDVADIDGIIISKADTDEKGGTALSVSYVTGKPLLYLGVGQGYNDLEKFNKKKIIDLLFK